MIVHLLDGTYELFRHFHGLRRFTKAADPPFGAVLGVLRTVLQMFETGATHVGVARSRGRGLGVPRTELFRELRHGLCARKRRLCSPTHPQPSLFP